MIAGNYHGGSPGSELTKENLIAASLEKKHVIEHDKDLHGRLMDGADDCATQLSNLLNSFITINALLASKPDVGSSRKKTGAFDTSSTATVSTFR